MLHSKRTFRIIFALCLLLMVGLSVQAQDTKRFALPFELAREAGLGTEINKAQKISFVNVTLQWAYADARGIFVLYTIGAGKMRTADGRSVQSVRLTDTNGTEFFLGQRSSYGAIETDSDLGFGTLRSAEAAFPESMKAADLPETLDLIFEVNADGYPLTAQDNSAATAIIAPESTQDAVPPDVFRFEFTVPVYPAVEQQVDEVQVINAVTLKLKSVSITPISTQVEVCAILPNDNFWEMRAPVLAVDGVEPMSRLMYSSAMLDGCRSLDLPIFAGLSPQQLHYEFEALVENPARQQDFDWVSLRPALAAYGVSITVDAEGQFTGARSEHPGDMTDALVELGYAERIDGPWVFDVDLKD